MLLIAIRLVRARPASPHPCDHDSLLLHNLSIIGLPRGQTRMPDQPRPRPVDGTDATVAYHKMWLGTAGSKRFSPGSKPAVLKVDGWRLGWPSARTLVFLSTPPIPPPSGSTPTWPPPQSSQPTQPSKMPVPVASPPTTIYGSRWPASLGQPAALPRSPASATSGPAKATFWLGQEPRPATSHARRSTDHQSQ